MSMNKTQTHYARVDLFGGTLDIHPLSLLLSPCATIEAITNIPITIRITESTENSGIVIESIDRLVKDQKKIDEIDQLTPIRIDGPLSLFWRVLYPLFPQMRKLEKSIHIQVWVQCPPGSGLGASSIVAMGLFRCMKDFLGLPPQSNDLQTVMDVESFHLALGPTGYQDYYSGLGYRGIFGIVANFGFKSVIEFDEDKWGPFLEKHISLIYSGDEHFSATTNWEIFQDYFNKKNQVVELLTQLAQTSTQALELLKGDPDDSILNLLKNEGKMRAQLVKGMVTPKVHELMNKLHEIDSEIGMKVCGAGGGGCFLVIHKVDQKELVDLAAKELSLAILPFCISKRTHHLITQSRDFLEKIKVPCTIIAVSKTKSIEDIATVYENTKLRHFGENYVHELNHKSNSFLKMYDVLKWHYIGAIQSNKIKELVNVRNLYAIHSIDREKILHELFKHAQFIRENNRFSSIKLFFQVNTSLEDSKSGLHTQEDLQILLDVYKKLTKEYGHDVLPFCGLMCIAAPNEKDAKSFKKLQQMLAWAKVYMNDSTLTTSMGMSDDYQSALEHQAHYLRIGSKIFGARS